MEKRSEKEKKINSLSDNDKESIQMIVQKLEAIVKSAKITEESVTDLEGMVIELCSLKDKHSKYLLRWFKQGYVDF